MLTLQNITYTHPNKDVLFDRINLNIGHADKVALIGNNGAGKSTLLQVMAGLLIPRSGHVKTESRPYYIPQHFGQYDRYTVAAALGAEEKIKALQSILQGNTSEENFRWLDDDWNIGEKCKEALLYWGLEHVNPLQKMGSLSGGQKTKVFLAGMLLHQPAFVLMDEPSNHLDGSSRDALYRYVRNTKQALVIVSHDRTLLNQVNQVCELSRKSIIAYGGNYDFYAAQKEVADLALQEDVKDKEKALRKAKEVERAAIEREQKLDARGKKKQEQAGLPTISMNTLRNSAEKSTARMKSVQAGKTGNIAETLRKLRKELPVKDKMRIGFSDSALHTRKVLVTARDMNHAYNRQPLWRIPLNFEICSGDRIAINGLNGSGKTTLIRIITGLLLPSCGVLDRAKFNTVYIDQDYTLVNNGLTIYDQAQQYNASHLQEHVVKSRLTHFLFSEDDWDKPCRVLSGGEKMRLILCCLTLEAEAPDMIILDEPVNNLDLQNIMILTEAVKDYSGTLLVVSHDRRFLKEVGINRDIELT